MVTVLFYPIADKCVNNCAYCFEDENHRKTKIYDSYNKYAMAQKHSEIVEYHKSINEHTRTILHGGEVLSLPIEDFEFFLVEMKKSQLNPSIQTSLGVPFTPEHIRLIKKYSVNIGVSVDGPRELNTLRGPRDPILNKKFQDTVYNNLNLLSKEGISKGCITILTKQNATGENLDKMIQWHIDNRIGGRFNPMFSPWYDSNPEIKEQELSPEELTIAYLKLFEATLKTPGFEFALASDMRKFLLGNFNVVCVLGGCDYLYTTCQTIMPDGEVSRCDRCFQDGYYYTSKTKNFDARKVALSQTECSHCRYFPFCGGSCPAEGANGDFRSKTRFCQAMYSLFEAVEKSLRASFKNIILATDIIDYPKDYLSKRKRFNPFRFENYQQLDDDIKLKPYHPLSKEQQQKEKGNCGCNKKKDDSGLQKENTNNQEKFMHADYPNSGLRH